MARRFPAAWTASRVFLTSAKFSKPSKPSSSAESPGPSSVRGVAALRFFALGTFLATPRVVLAVSVVPESVFSPGTVLVLRSLA